MKLGEHSLETEIDCEGNVCADPPQVIYPETIIVPKEYNGEHLKHDLAIVKLSKPADITQWVSPVCLPNNDFAKKNLVGEIVEVCTQTVKAENVI